MKDYKLSEIKSICGKSEKCEMCEIYDLCNDSFSLTEPLYWDVETEKTTESKDTTSAQKKVYLILKDIDKLIVDLESLEEIHNAEHEQSVINDELDELRHIKGNLRATFKNAVEDCINADMETYTPLRQLLEVK